MVTLHIQNGGHLWLNQSWSMIRVRKYVKWICWPLKHMFRCKSHMPRCSGFKVTAIQKCSLFWAAAILKKRVKILFLMEGFLGAFWGWILGPLGSQTAWIGLLAILSRFPLYMGYFDQIIHGPWWFIVARRLNSRGSSLTVVSIGMEHLSLVTFLLM